MNPDKDQLSVEVMDRRLQVDLDAQQKEAAENNNNQFLQEKEHFSDQQESDQEPSYKIDNLIPKQSQKQRLIQQNIKLKTQIYELAKQLDQILTKDKSKKKNYGMNLPKIQEQDEIIRERRLQIQRQQIEIQDLKSKIFISKRQLQCVYNHETIRAKEDQIKILKAELKIMEDQKEGHLNIQKLQTKALKISKNQEEYSQKIKSVTDQYYRLRKDSKHLIEKISISEKILMKTHDNYVSKHEKIKQLQQKLALNKEKSKTKKPTQQAITQQMIQTMQSQLKKLELQRKQGEKIWQDKIRAVDIELLLKRNEQQKKMIILRQKQKQLRLNELKIKELKKLARQVEDISGANETKRSHQEMDMSQYRHKRNIRYLQK